MQKTTELFTFFQLQHALANGTVEAHVLNVQENEAVAIFSAVEGLLSSDLELRLGVVKGLLSGEGEWQGVPCQLRGLFVFSINLLIVRSFEIF